MVGGQTKEKLLLANAVELSWSSSRLNEKSSCYVELLMNEKRGGLQDSYRSPFDWLKKYHPPCFTADLRRRPAGPRIIFPGGQGIVWTDGRIVAHLPMLVF